jgi:hypothetical protein
VSYHRVKAKQEGHKKSVVAFLFALTHLHRFLRRAICPLDDAIAAARPVGLAWPLPPVTAPNRATRLFRFVVLALPRTANYPNLKNRFPKPPHG